MLYLERYYSLLYSAIFLTIYLSVCLCVLLFINVSGIILTFAIKPDKRYSKIDQHLARHFLDSVNVFTNPLPFYATQIINPFLT